MDSLGIWLNGRKIGDWSVCAGEHQFRYAPSLGGERRCQSFVVVIAAEKRPSSFVWSYG